MNKSDILRAGLLCKQQRHQEIPLLCIYSFGNFDLSENCLSITVISLSV